MNSLSGGRRPSPKALAAEVTCTNPLYVLAFTPISTNLLPVDPPSKQAVVTPLLAKVSVENMQLLLGNLTAFHNRFFESETGAAASLWIHDTVADLGDAFPDSKLEVLLFEHNFPQTSIIATFPGEDPEGPVTILGAHMDSINLDDVNGRAPGADDDGSGSVNLLEAVRVLAESGFQPKTPVEFHWYAGEEVGLLGSQDIAQEYNETGIEVKGMLQFDMTAL